MVRFRAEVLGLYRDLGRRPLTTCKLRQVLAELAEILAGWMPLCKSVWLFPGIRRATPWRGGRVGHRPIDSLRVAAKAAGVSCPGWHALRHSWITHALTRWNIHPEVVRLIAGHTSPETTQIYCHPDVANLTAATERISYRT